MAKTSKKNTGNKSKVKNLRKRSRYHNTELQKLHKQESGILKTEGYEERSHMLMWLLVIIAIVVSIVWFLLRMR